MIAHIGSMLIIVYAAGAVAVAVAAFLFSEWVRDPGGSPPDGPGALAVVAGLLWPVLAVGLIQWLLIAALAARIREATLCAADSEMMPMPVRIDAKP